MGLHLDIKWNVCFLVSNLTASLNFCKIRINPNLLGPYEYGNTLKPSILTSKSNN